SPGFAHAGAGNTAPVPSPAPAATPSPDPANLGLAREVIAVAFPPDRRQAMLNQFSDNLMAQMRDGMLRATGNRTDPALEPIFNRYVERVRSLSVEINRDGAPAMFEAMARAYARTFNRDELVQIRAFLSTPAGAHYLEGSIEMLGDPDVAEANRAHMARAFTALQPLMEELRRDLAAHFAAQR